MSSADGVGSPLGWLWTPMKAAAFARMSALNPVPSDDRVQHDDGRHYPAPDPTNWG